MLSLKNMELLKESGAAQASFRRLRQFNQIIMLLTAILVLLAIWNIATLVSILRADAPDLADISTIGDHISTRLIYIVAAAIVVVFAFKEWKWGERGISMLGFLLPLMFLALIPVMTAETEPQIDTFPLEFRLNSCEEGGVIDGLLVDAEKCALADIPSGNILMATSNPLSNDDVVILEPSSTSSSSGKWVVTGSGEFTVYFMLKQESLESCESAMFATSAPVERHRDSSCMEYDGFAWSVHPFETSRLQTSWLVVYQEAAP